MMHVCPDCKTRSIAGNMFCLNCGQKWLFDDDKWTNVTKWISIGLGVAVFLSGIAYFSLT